MDIEADDYLTPYKTYDMVKEESQLPVLLFNDSEMMGKLTGLQCFIMDHPILESTPKWPPRGREDRRNP